MSKTLDHVRALLKQHNIGIGMLRKPVAKGGAGIAPLPAEKLLGQRPGEVSIVTVEKALALIRRELTTRRKPIA
jgi:hypothetical protein